MAFLVEQIPEAAIKDFLSEHRVYNGTVAAITSRWGIDHERNAMLVLTGKVGGAYEGTQETKYFSLYWNGEQTRLAADPLNKDYPQDGAVMNWRIHAVQIPDTLQGRREQVLELIREAFRAYGDCFNGHRFVAVNVHFGPSSTN